MARCECTVLVEYEETEVVLELDETVVTVEPEGPQGPPGIGVRDGSLTLGNFVIEYNGGRNSLDFRYQEGD